MVVDIFTKKPIELKPVNFLAKEFDEQVRDLLIDSTVLGSLLYTDLALELQKLGYYMPEDQYIAYETLIHTQIELDIGGRQHELGRKKEEKTACSSGEILV
jgi:hypothetical protein